MAYTKDELDEIEERILDQCIFDKVSDCWLWQGPTVKGYGMLRIGESMRYVHRVMWAIKHGRIPKPLTVDHVKCQVTHCCNPAHMELVTRAENSRRARGVKDGKCKRGHAVTGWNAMKRSDGRTSCRTCFNDSCRRSHARSRALVGGT